MIFDELSNAYFHFVLQRLGADLDGEGASRRPPPPPQAADHGSFRAPARRGLIYCASETVITQQIQRQPQNARRTAHQPLVTSPQAQAKPPAPEASAPDPYPWCQEIVMALN